MSVIKKDTSAPVGLLGVAILAGIASGLIAGLVGGDPAAVAEWCAWPTWLWWCSCRSGWMVVVVFFDQIATCMRSGAPPWSDVGAGNLGALAAV